MLRTRMRSPGPCGAGRRQDAGGPERPGRVGRDLSDGKRSCDSAAVSALCCNVHRRHLAPSQPSARSARRHDAVCRARSARGAGRWAGAARTGVNVEMLKLRSGVVRDANFIAFSKRGVILHPDKGAQLHVYVHIDVYTKF